VCYWVVQELANKLVDSAVKSCREQHALSVTWCLRQDLRDVLEEPEFSHVVSFVKNRDLNCIEVDVTRFHEVNETTWASNNDVNTIAQCFDLLWVTNATVNGGGTHTEATSEWCKYVTHLVCQLASWNQDQCTWCIVLAWLVALEQTSQQWQCECKRLA
jgi:hypothetical protein